MAQSKAKMKKAVALVEITAPKITTAWNALTNVTAENDKNAILAITSLAKEIKLSGLSINDIKAVIKKTGNESGLVKLSHVEGLTTWLAFQKYKEFKALALDRQLSSAVSSYKLLGSGKGEQIKTWGAIAKAIKEARAVKNAKSKASKAPTSAKTKAEKKSQKETLIEMSAWISALDVEAMDEDTKDALAVLITEVEAKNEVLADI